MAAFRAGLLLLVFMLVNLWCIPWQESALRFRLKRRKTFPNRYHRFVSKLFGIRIHVVGKPVQGAGVLMVANHTSWLDIIILSATARLHFIAKAEVAGWPFFGTLARLQETVYVQRARRSETGQARDSIRERLIAGDALVLFAEGTSSDGNRILPFKSALMGAAEARIGLDDHPVPVQPVSVAYTGLYGMPMGRENRPFFAWYGDMDLVPHLWEALKAGPLDVVVEYHPVLDIVSAGGRKNLAETAEKMVRAGQVRALNNYVPAEA